MCRENCNGDMKHRVVFKPMDAEQLREYGHKVVDFVADYYKNIESFPVLSQVKPGYLKEILPQSAPSHPEPLEDVLNVRAMSNGYPRFKVVAPRTFALVCFRLEAPENSPDNGDKVNRDLLEAVNSSGDIFLSYTVISSYGNDLRFAVGAPLTEERHVKAAWKLLQEKATSLLEQDAL